MNKKIKISCCISGRGLGFRAIAEACKAGLISAKISKIICDRKSSILAYADKQGIKSELINYCNFPQRKEFDLAVERSLLTEDPDWVFLTYNRLLPKSTINLFNNRILNQHMSLLPLFPGFGSIKAAYKSGMKVAGVTIHFITPKMDDGPIVAQAIIPIDHSKSYNEFGFDLFKISVPLQIQVLRWACLGVLSYPLNGNIVSIDDCKYNQGSFFPAIDSDILLFSELYINSLQLE